ncbi:MAG: hypothetical protein ACK4WD_12185 [Flavobacteriales bacterium]
MNRFFYQFYADFQNTGNKGIHQQQLGKSGGALLRKTVFSYNWSAVLRSKGCAKSPAFAKLQTVCVLNSSCVAGGNAVQKMEDGLNFQNHECEVQANGMVDSLEVWN